MKEGTRTINVLALAIATTLLLATAANAATPAQKCEAGKNGTVGKYAACLHKAQQKFVSGGELDAVARDAAILGCGTKYADKWRGLEGKAGAMVCPSEGDEASIQDFLDACIFTAEDALSGGTLPSDVVSCNIAVGTCTNSLGTCTGNLGTCNGDIATANAGTAAVGDVLSGKTFTSTAGLGASGTMPNNGAVTLTPTASDQAIAAGYHDGSGKCAGDADLVAGNIKNGVNLFGVTGTVSAGGLQETGQTICYDTAGTVIACTGTGQDAELQKGVANSFTDNGNGTVTDNLTGLMWEKLSDDGTIHDWDATYTWANAFSDKVATLNSTIFAGYSDWRVPNAKELQTLQNFGAVSPGTFSAFNNGCSLACTVLTCSCTQSGFYWSSTSHQGAPSFAWIVTFTSGYTNYDYKPNSWPVRAVRAGS